jgi:acetamidase/formamidase
MALHEIPLERRALHGHFSCDLEPVLTIRSGDSVAFACPSSGWFLPSGERFEPRSEDRDAGHALTGPIGIEGARAGQVLEVRVDAVRVAGFGVTTAAGWPTPLNERLGMDELDEWRLDWALDADAGLGRDQFDREIELRPFLGVMGMPPALPGIHPTQPPRPSGGNIDCSELVAGTSLYLPIPVDGALFSAGDGHARQGDGEVSQLAIECPVDRAQLTLVARDDMALDMPIARTSTAWIAFGFDEDLDEAAAQAIEGMLALMEREHGLDRRDALALASVVLDLRVTQLVNGAKGVHAVLRHDAVRMP